jgi:hypothetical protein
MTPSRVAEPFATWTLRTNLRIPYLSNKLFDIAQCSESRVDRFDSMRVFAKVVESSGEECANRAGHRHRRLRFHLDPLPVRADADPPAT